MTQRKCPQARLNMCWDKGDCDECSWNKLITRYERKVKRLQKQKQAAEQLPDALVAGIKERLPMTEAFTTQQLELLHHIFDEQLQVLFNKEKK
ncbi:MAG: hypothetical protein NC218_01770 [Acetobacter sp.]|nr:hypothetical protein [Acetobacter sp.]